MNNLVLTWKDQDGKTYRKVYKDQRTAYKALQWVIDNGGINADVAIVRTNVKSSSE